MNAPDESVDAGGPLAGKTLCITGGAGFIGTALIRRLADHCKIRVL